MAQVFDLIHKAKEGVLFLLFKPGKPCILDAVREAQEKNPISSSAARPPMLR